MLLACAPMCRLKWFDSISYVIGGARWSSNDVEHGALRGNAPSPASLLSLLGKPQWAGRTFKAGDPRAALAIQVGGCGWRGYQWCAWWGRRGDVQEAGCGVRGCKSSCWVAGAPHILLSSYACYAVTRWPTASPCPHLSQPVDPRIHFALNCGAASCPPIRIYTPDRLEFGLAAAAGAFCASEGLLCLDIATALCVHRPVQGNPVNWPQVLCPRIGCN